MRISDWSSDVCSSDLSVVRDQLDGTAIVYGLCLGGFGAGTIFAALWIGKARHRWGSDRVVGASALVFAAAMAAIALSHSLSPMIAAAFVAGMCWVSTMTTLNVAMQLRSPEAILGRCLRSEGHTSELQSLMRTSSAVFCLKKKK